MIFLEKIPPLLEALVSGTGNRVAAVSADLDLQGKFGEEWLVLTRSQLQIYETVPNAPRLRFSAPVAELESVRSDTLVGGGALVLKHKGACVELLRYTNRKERKFLRIAKYLADMEKHRKLAEKDRKRKPEPVLEEDKEEEGRCPKCGLNLPKGSKVCPKCMNKGKVMLRLAGYLRPYWKETVLLWLLMFGTMCLNLIPPYLHRPLIDVVLTPKATDALPSGRRLSILGWLVLALLATRVAGQVVTIVRGRMIAWLGARLSHDLRTQLYGHLQELSLRFFDQRQTGAIMARLMHDTQSLESALLGAVPHLVVQLLTFFGIFTVLMVMNWKLTLLVLLPAPFVVLLSRLFWKRIHRLWHRFWHFRQRLSAQVNDSLSGVRVIKAFAQEEQETLRFGSRSGDLCLAETKAEKAHATFFPLLTFVIGSGTMIVWYAGGRQVVGESLTLGTLMAFVAYLGMFYGPLQFLSRFTDWLVRALASAERIFEILDRSPDVKEADDAVDHPSIKGHVEFRGITFGYDRHKPVLHEIDLDVQPGEMIGLVGHSGAGKSTTINLLCRFYDVDDGEILIDGTSIRKIRQADLRSQIGVVLQDTFLFSGTIAENIRYANPKATHQEIMDAAKTANAHDFIVQKPDGYDTRVGERGQMLSGGERQRIAIARAILHNPRILILDEATSSVDTDTEKQIQEAIARLIRGRTTFAIAHRLSTLRNASRLVVLKDGKIQEVGTHDELLERKGEFHRLVKLQSEISQIEAIGR